MTEGYNSTSLLWRVELGVGMVMGFQEVTGGKLSGWSRRDTWHENRLKKKDGGEIINVDCEISTDIGFW